MKKGLFVLASILILGLTSCSNNECTCTATSTIDGQKVEVKATMEDVSKEECEAGNMETTVGDVTVKTVCK